MKPREGSTAYRAIELIRQHGTARSGWLAEQLGITTSTLSAQLSAYTKDGTLVSCLVRVGDEGSHQNEYRLAAAGAGMEFRIRSDVAGRGPLVRDGTIARETPRLPSGLHIEEERGRANPKPALTQKQTSELARVWPGVDPQPMEAVTDDFTIVGDHIAPVDVPLIVTAGGPEPVKPATPAQAAESAPEPAPIPAPPQVSAPRSAFRCALANDGSLLLMIPGNPALDLNPTDTRALVEYLRKLDELGAPRIPAAMPALVGVQAQ